MIGLITARLTHEDPHIRCDAVKALGMLADRGDPDAVHASVAGLADEDGNVRRASVDSLRKLAMPLPETLAAICHHLDKMRNPSKKNNKNEQQHHQHEQQRRNDKSVSFCYPSCFVLLMLLLVLFHCCRRSSWELCGTSHGEKSS